MRFANQRQHRQAVRKAEKKLRKRRLAKAGGTWVKDGPRYVWLPRADPRPTEAGGGPCAF